MCSECWCRNADAYWSTDVLPYFPYSSNRCPHGGAGGGHCILPDEQIWDYKLLQSTLQYLELGIPELIHRY